MKGSKLHLGVRKVEDLLGQEALQKVGLEGRNPWSSQIWYRRLELNALDIASGFAHLSKLMNKLNLNKSDQMAMVT